MSLCVCGLHWLNTGLLRQNMTYDGVDIGEAVQPIQDRVETYQSNGYAVVSPGDALSAGAYAVTVNSGNLDASDTLSVGSSNDEILFDGSVKSLSSTTNVRINSVSPAGDGTEQYRYDVIYADSSGEIQKTEGSVTKLDSRESQNNLTRFERFKGAIPNPASDPSVIIVAVIVNSNDSSVGTGQLRDYRVSATHKVSALEANRTHITRESPIVRGTNGWRSDFDGADPDARLDNALSNAAGGDVVYLENADYASRTINTSLKIIGTASHGSTVGTSLTGNWTIDRANIALNALNLGGNTVTLQQASCSVTEVAFGSVQINANGCAVTDSRDVAVTFDSSANDCIADTLYAGSTVSGNTTDNLSGDVI